MARARLNPILESVRGAIADTVFKQYGSRTVITRKPVFVNRIFSEAQRANQEKFRQAELYARKLSADPRVMEVYKQESRLTGKPVRSLMMADFYRAQSTHG